MFDINIEKLNTTQINDKKIKSWPIWKKEISTFDWTYDIDEECYILEGEVVIETEKGEVYIKAGDFVSFPKGLKCVWNIKAPVKKHYNFK